MASNVTEVTIHKQEGKERYAWYEEKGVWKKKWLVPIPAQPTQGGTLPAGKSDYRRSPQSAAPSLKRSS